MCQGLGSVPPDLTERSAGSGPAHRGACPVESMDVNANHCVNTKCSGYDNFETCKPVIFASSKPLLMGVQSDVVKI